jgi:phospholipase C
LGRVHHIVVLMQENRSFDHYFGALHHEGQTAVDAEPTRGNPDPRNPSARITPFHAQSTCEVADLNHEWSGLHAAIDGGRMDGFTAQNVIGTDPTGKRAMGYFDASDLPFYYRLANTFGIGDRYYSPVAGNSLPNWFYALAATSFGHIGNFAADVPPSGGFAQPTIFGRLEQARISWKVYEAQYAAPPIFSPYVLPSFFADVQSHQDHVRPISDYFADAAAGTLPEVSLIEPASLGTVSQENDEHPPSNIQVGQRFAETLVRALTRSSDWRSSIFLLTYDENGGYFDHVAPPPAPVPDDIAPRLAPGDTPAAFDRYGVRVPFIAVSPFSKPHFVSHRVSDHTSILALIERRFHLRPLTRRDQGADPLLEYFDFTRPHFTKPPALPAATIDPAQAAHCAVLQPGILGM